MRLGNLAYDIQSKAESRLAVIAFLHNSSSERMKDMVQILFPNRQPAVLHDIINYENSDSITLRKVLYVVISSSAQFHEL
jgi:hypothetical protein